MYKQSYTLHNFAYDVDRMGINTLLVLKKELLTEFYNLPIKQRHKFSRFKECLLEIIVVNRRLKRIKEAAA